MFLGIMITAFNCILSVFSLCAQEIPYNQIYEHERLYFNDLLVLQNHKVLLVKDRMNESKRKMFLLDNTNQVTDTMKTNAIIDLIVISDTCFLVHDVNYTMKITIKNDRLVSSDIHLTLSDFSSALGTLAYINKRAIVFQKYDEKNGCNCYYAMKPEEKLYCLRRTPFPDEEQMYKLGKKDTIKVLSFTLPGMCYFPIRKKQQKFTIKNKDINPFPILSSQEIGKRKTDVCYGADNLEESNDSLFIYERNSCSLFVFDLKNQLKSNTRINFPIENQKTEGWKYIFDTNKKIHYAIKRIRDSVAEGLNDTENKISHSYLYQVYKIDTFSKRLIELCKIPTDPLYISEGLIYYTLSNSRLSSSKILAYPLDPTKSTEKKVFIQ